MQLHHLVVTLTAAAAPITTDKTKVGRYVSLQGFAGNSGSVYVGGISDANNTQTASATVYGIVLPPPDSSGNAAAPYPLDPWNAGAFLTLNDIWLFGTNADKVSVSYWK